MFSLKMLRSSNIVFFHELQKALEGQLALPYDVVIHAAAVSDLRLLKHLKIN